MYRIFAILCAGFALQSAGCQSLFLPHSEESQSAHDDSVAMPPAILAETRPPIEAAQIPPEPALAEVPAAQTSKATEVPQESLTTKLSHLPERTATTLAQVPEKTATSLFQLSAKTTTTLTQLQEKTARGIADVSTKAIKSITPSEDWKQRHEAACVTVEAVTITALSAPLCVAIFLCKAPLNLSGN
jgi:hypothetical protein